MNTITTHEDFLKRYHYDPIKDRLGVGGFGSVYKAYDTVLHRDVAIKIAEVKKSETGKKIFSLRDEVLAVSKLPDHPNVAHYEKNELYTFTLSNGMFDHAVMQYYPDGNLTEATKAGLTANQKEDIARQLLEGVAFLHEHKVVHRDLKPANILIVKHGGKITPVIIDFGLSKSVDETMFNNSFTGGTRRYSAPEQLQGGQPLKLNVDLWSYGVIVYELFTGKPLFSADSGASDSEQTEKEIFDKITKGNVGSLLKMPEKWRKVVERCLVVDTEKRVQNADELFEILDDYNGDNGDNRGDGFDFGRWKKYVKIGLAAMAVIAIIVVLCLWLRPKPIKEDTRRFLACKVVDDYRLYLKDFPDGKHFEEASHFIKAFIADSIADTQNVFIVNGVSFTMKHVEGGSFWMGSDGEEAGSDEQPVHKVTVEDFYIGETEVTQALWKVVMGENPSQFKHDSLPVESVNWDDCQEFCFKLNEATEIKPTGMVFRLPTEAEWEYAARGGVKDADKQYSGSDIVDDVAWEKTNSEEKTHKVKQKAPNELGLYDMSGNVWEWCLDVYDCYPNGKKENLKGKRKILYRVLRGGSWYYLEGACRVSARGNCEPFKRLSSGGMRLVLSTPIQCDDYTSNPESVSMSSVSTNGKPTSIALSYGEWQGKCINGKPDGDGKLVMKKSHSFGGLKVEAGTVVEALFENGELITGKVYNKNGELINTIMP